jgi:hypothetical protein
MYLFLGLLFSSVGGVFMIVGKRIYETPFLVCGALLIVVSYLVVNPILLFLVGSAVTAVPFAIRRGWF